MTKRAVPLVDLPVIDLPEGDWQVWSAGSYLHDHDVFSLPFSFGDRPIDHVFSDGCRQVFDEAGVPYIAEPVTSA